MRRPVPYPHAEAGVLVGEEQPQGGEGGGSQCGGALSQGGRYALRQAESRENEADVACCHDEEEDALRALAKLEQVLPSRLRRRVRALQAYTVTVPADRPAPAVSAEVLTTLVSACRDRERLRFDYLDHGGSSTLRIVEPYRAVNWGRRWYLVAWDVEREDWRTFRVDRIRPRTPAGPRFAPRELPGGDAASYVARRVSGAAWRYHARVEVHAPAAAVIERINPAVGSVEAVDASRCLLTTGADTVQSLAVHLGMLDLDFDVTEPPELVAHLRRLASRYTRSTPPDH
ncbi:WYL domain-containing protein [Streptomyces sp. XY431]|uniref:helix-turn-helix transcriptional regulator n=1 Tax=Streptomyces sp. XY431 TaxID=1415562 RepID=UPI00099B3A3E|nr:WYL domain-containing protein [Streptomyces sp. XY431]